MQEAYQGGYVMRHIWYDSWRKLFIPRNDCSVVTSFGTDISRFPWISAGPDVLPLLVNWHQWNMMVGFLIWHLNELKISHSWLSQSLDSKDYYNCLPKFLLWTATSSWMAVIPEHFSTSMSIFIWNKSWDKLNMNGIIRRDDLNGY